MTTDTDYAILSREEALARRTRLLDELQALPKRDIRSHAGGYGTGATVETEHPALLAQYLRDGGSWEGAYRFCALYQGSNFGSLKYYGAAWDLLQKLMALEPLTGKTQGDHDFLLGEAQVQPDNESPGAGAYVAPNRGSLRTQGPWMAGRALLKGKATLHDWAQVRDNAQVLGGRIGGNAVVCGNAIVYQGHIHGTSHIGGSAVILGGSWTGEEGPVTEGVWTAPGKQAMSEEEAREEARAMRKRHGLYWTVKQTSTRPGAEAWAVERATEPEPWMFSK